MVVCDLCHKPGEIDRLQIVPGSDYRGDVELCKKCYRAIVLPALRMIEQAVLASRQSRPGELVELRVCNHLRGRETDG